MISMRKVVLESPYAGKTPEEINRNVSYAKLALRDSLLRGEAPLMSHLLHTQVLNDSIPAHRKMGIEAGHAWIEHADAVIVCSDYGVSKGMQIAVELANKLGIPVHARFLLENHKGDLIWR